MTSSSGRCATRPATSASSTLSRATSVSRNNNAMSAGRARFPDHHELLRLKRQGLPLQEIAARTGLHEGSVRRILRQLARQLALGPTPPDPDAL